MFIFLVNDIYEFGELNEINVIILFKFSWYFFNFNLIIKYKFYLRACILRGCGKLISEEGVILGEGSKCLDFLYFVYFYSYSEV